MKNKPTLFDEILHGNLQPWLSENKPDVKFAAMLSSIKTSTFDFQNHFEIEFFRPFNHKTKYYHKLITQGMIDYCNAIIELISEDDTPNLQKFWINDTLEKKLKTRLRDVGKIIRESDYDLIYINPKKTSFDIDQDHKTDTYIIHYLKLALIQVYGEIQEYFKPLIADYLIEEDFYTQLLFEPVPDKSFLNKKTTIQIEIPEQVESPEQAVIVMEPKLKYETFSFTYKQLKTDPDKLTDLCDSLRKGNFISTDTTTANFRKVFSGKEITNPIKWTGSSSDFYYFIHLIYNKHQLVEDLKQKQWKVACACFVSADGSLFDPSSVRVLKRPALTGDNLDKAVKLLL